MFTCQSNFQIFDSNRRPLEQLGKPGVHRQYSTPVESAQRQFAHGLWRVASTFGDGNVPKCEEANYFINFVIFQSELDINDSTQQELDISDAARFLSSFSELADVFVFASGVSLNEVLTNENPNSILNFFKF